MNEFADTREYLVVHQGLRLTLNRFVEATERLDPAVLAGVIKSRWALFARSLHHHHEVEDADFFPMIKRARPDTSVLVDRLESEHRELVDQLAAVDDAIDALESDAGVTTKQAVHTTIKTVRDNLVPHLDVEDAELLPAAAESVRADEWKRTSEQALRSIPKKDLPIVAGAIDEVVRSLPKEKQPPPPPLLVRALVALSWRKRYAKFIEPLITA